MKLIDRQRLAISMLVHKGMRKSDVAAELKVSRDTISRWFNDENFVTLYRKTLQERIDSEAALAIQRITELMYSRSPSVALAAAKDIASRAGLDAVTKQDIKVEATTVVVDYGDEE